MRQDLQAMRRKMHAVLQTLLLMRVMATHEYQIIVIGAGAGGLVVAIGAAKAGKKVLLIEKGLYGGDCTNFGCIPSKSLIASAEVAHAIRNANDFGFEGASSLSPTNRVFERVKEIVSSVRSHEEPSALQSKGIETCTATASFIDPHHLKVTEKTGKSYEVYGENIVIATGSSPLIPPIQGLSATPYLTNETIFDLKGLPKRLCIVGGGPIGCEMALAFSRLGSNVTQIHRHPTLLNKEEPEAQRLISDIFTNEGIDLLLGFDTQSVSFSNDEFKITITSQDTQKEIVSDAILVAVGREPNTQSLLLENARVNFSEKGIHIDKYGRTTQKHIWAIGDVVQDGPKFTHAAENQARKVLLSLLLPMKYKLQTQSIPRTTFTDPEVASFGMLEKKAKELYGKNIAVYYVPLSENDRAITASKTDGFVKIITKKISGQILGTTIVAPRAGEMIAELLLAAKEKIPLRKISSLIHPYPTYNLAIRKAADLWLTQTFLPWIRNPFKEVSWKKFIPISIIIILLIVFYILGIEKYFSTEYLRSNYQELKSFVNLHPILSPILFIFIYAASTAILIPAAAFLDIVGGFLFGVPWSTFYVMIGATSGACALFLAVRMACSEMLSHMAGPALKKMVKGFQKNAWSYLLFLRLVPLFPFWMVNIAAGFFEVNFWTFLWTTFVGIIPGAYAYTQAGAGIGEILASQKPLSFSTIFNTQMIIALVAIGILIIASYTTRKIFKKGKTIDG